MVHQPIGWWSGNSPEWITLGDVPQLVARQPLFVRKVKSDERQLREMLSALQSAHRQVYDTLMTTHQQRKVISQLLSPAQQQRFSSLIVSPTELLAAPSEEHQLTSRYYERYRTITHSDTLLATDPSLAETVLEEVREEEQALTTLSPHEPIYYLTAMEIKKSRGKKSERRVCVRISKTDGSLEWVACAESAKVTDRDRDGDTEMDLTPTAFVLRNCIGNVTVTAQTEPEEESCANENESNNKSGKGPLVTTSELSDGFLLGHCSLVSIDEIRTLSGHPFCLSPALVKYNTNYNKGPSAISYNDIHGQRISGSGIGFLPCDVDYSVGYAEQLFVFPRGSSAIEYGTRFSRSKEFIKGRLESGRVEELTRGRIDGKTRSDPSLCVVRKDHRQLGLLACSEAKKKEKVTLMLAHRQTEARQRDD
jgi:hypothetical protein